MRSLTRSFTSALLQKSKDSSKRKAEEKEVSDSDDDTQLSDEARRPAAKTVKKVSEGTRFEWAIRLTLHGSQEFP
jgi:hypothetical protein